MREMDPGSPHPPGESALREEVRSTLEAGRAKIRDFNGLSSREDLAGDVLRTCHAAIGQLKPDPRLTEALHTVEVRCRQLARVADRFADRDPAAIAASRALAQAALETVQDAIFELRKLADQPRGSGSLLKRPAQSPSSPSSAGSGSGRRRP